MCYYSKFKFSSFKILKLIIIIQNQLPVKVKIIFIKKTKRVKIVGKGNNISLRARFIHNYIYLY